ncbi:protein phosphatase 2C domain-containing protein [Anaerovibrio sp. JC8]|uniref:protein phosphatase 2C domain-containing protein n=1 Tax=Anaerovibrio sp. JC8 TaxID=1240085 RepID=UPI000A10BF3A
MLSKIINKLDELSENLGCEKKECASTLLAVAVKGDRFVLMHIGDGVIGYTKDNKIKIASYPDNGEFSNVTVFTTSSDAIFSMKLLKGELNGIDSFILMSDGTEAGLYHKKNKSLTSALVRVVDFVRFFPELTVRGMLVDSLKNVIQQVTVDDCSIAIIADDYGKDVRHLPISEQRDLLAVGSKKYPAHKSKRMNRINYILSMLEQPIAIDEIARRLHIKKKYVRKYTDFLESKGIIEQCGNKFIYLR